jgi:hypothetical protein
VIMKIGNLRLHKGKKKRKIREEERGRREGK